RSNRRASLSEPFFLRELDALPWRIPKNAIEAAGPAGQFVFADLVGGLGPEYFREGQMPVKEVVLVSEPEQFFFLGQRDVVRIVLPAAKDGLGDLERGVTALLADEGRTPGIGEHPGVLICRRAHQLDEVLFLGGQ